MNATSDKTFSRTGPQNDPPEGAKPLLFEHPRGWLNSLTTDYVDPATTIPYCKGTKAGIRKVGEMPGIKDTLSFVPTNRA